MPALSLAVTTWGNRSAGRRALIVHGLASSAAGWWRLGPALAELGYAVVAPDLRGHGHSPRADSYGLGSYTEDVVALGGEWDLVLGHSMGGAIVLEMLGADSSLTSQVVLEDPLLTWGNPDFAEEWLTEDFRHPLTGEAVADRNPNWHVEDARLKAEALNLTTEEIVLATVRATPDLNLVGSLVAVTTPTLLLGADRSIGPALVFEELGESVAQMNDKVHFEMIRGSSHSMHRDQWEAFWGSVVRWIDG